MEGWRKKNLMPETGLLVLEEKNVGRKDILIYFLASSVAQVCDANNEIGNDNTENF